MRVLFIHERFSPDVGGGGEYVALERARGMIARGHSVRVICAGDPAVRDYQGVPTRRFRIPRKLVALLLPLAVIEARRADIVHGFSFHAAPLAWLAARLARRPVVCEQLGLFGPVWREMRPGLGGRVHQLLERLQLWLPFDGHVFLSDGSLQLARRAGFRGRAHVIAPGVEAAPAGAASAPGPGDPIILFAGRLDRRKGLDRLYQTAIAMPEARFEAVGWQADAPPPPPPPNLRLIEGRGAPYRDALARASIFFLPSRAETFGLVIYEAMRAGCTIVSTIAGDYQGVHLDPWDETAAIAALRRRLADPALRRREAEANRERAAAYTWDRSNARVQEIYTALVPPDRAPHGPDFSGNRGPVEF